MNHAQSHPTRVSWRCNIPIGALALASLFSSTPSAALVPRRGRGPSFASKNHDSGGGGGGVRRDGADAIEFRDPDRRPDAANNEDEDGGGIVMHDLPSSRRRRAFSMLAGHLPPLVWMASLDVAPAPAEDRTASSADGEPRECRNGGIVSESAVPGAYQQTCMNLDTRSFFLRSSGDQITMYQGTNAAGGMAGRTGVAVWNSGILLTRLLDALSQPSPSVLEKKSVLELGCGTGLVSVAASKLGASSVLATDANREVLALAQRNIERNDVSDVAKTAALQWGLLDAAEYENVADVVVGSDLTYNSGSWVALAETMATVMRQEGIVIYLTLGHSGFNVGGELGGFLSIVENAGLRLLTKDDKVWDECIGSRSIDNVLASVITAEEKSIIDANGGARAVVLAKKKVSWKG